MTPSTGNNERDTLRSQVKFQRVVIVGLVFISCALLGLLAYALYTAKVLVTPPEVRRSYEIGANYGNADYLSDMASYVLDKVFTVTPETVDYNNKIILKMAHPDGYATLKTTLDAAALAVKKDRITTIWVPRIEKINEKAKSVEYMGQIKTFIADKLTSQKEKSYFVQFNITSSGRLYVLKVEEIVKHDSTAAKLIAQP